MVVTRCWEKIISSMLKVIFKKFFKKLKTHFPTECTVLQVLAIFHSGTVLHNCGPKFYHFKVGINSPHYHPFRCLLPILTPTPPQETPSPPHCTKQLTCQILFFKSSFLLQSVSSLVNTKISPPACHLWCLIRCCFSSNAGTGQLL